MSENKDDKKYTKRDLVNFIVMYDSVRSKISSYSGRPLYPSQIVKVRLIFENDLQILKETIPKEEWDRLGISDLEAKCKSMLNIF